MTPRKLQNLNFLDSQNFPRATCMRNTWPQSNKLFKLRNETSCTNIPHGFPFFDFLGWKKQSLHFSLCGQLLFIIRCKTKVYLPQILWFTHPTFFKRSSNFPTQFWCSMTSAQLDFVLCPTLYGWCLSHAWCTPWIERTSEICFLLYKIDRSKVAQ